MYIVATLPLNKPLTLPKNPPTSLKTPLKTKTNIGLKSDRLVLKNLRCANNLSFLNVRNFESLQWFVG